MRIPTPDASTGGKSRPQSVCINGVPHHVIDERDGLIQVRRPNGVKRYWAVRLPDSPLYGEDRARLVITRVGACVPESGERS